MNIIEEIHQYLTDTQRNNYDIHGGEPEFLRVHSPTMASNIPDATTWLLEIIWDHHDGEIQVAGFEGNSLEEAGQKVLAYLKAEDEPEKQECPECGLTREHTHEI